MTASTHCLDSNTCSTIKKHQTVHASLFESFVREHAKWYPNAIERARRFGIFRRNLKQIDLLNSKEQGTAVYGITKYADMTGELYHESHFCADYRLDSQLTSSANHTD